MRLEKERCDKYKTCIQCRKGVFELEPSGLATKGNLLALGCRVRNLGLGVANKKILSVGHLGRVNSVGDWGPKGAANEDERQRRPEGVRHQAEENVSDAVALLEEAAVRNKAYSNQCQINECEVEERHVVDEDGPQTTEHVLLELGITLIQGRGERTGGLESLCFSAKPFWQGECSNDAESNVRRHPKLVTRASLASVIAGGNKENKLAETVDNGVGKAGTNEPSKLCIVGVGDQGFAHDQNDGNGKERDGQQDRVQTKRGVEEAGEALGKCHLADLFTPETKVELERRIHGTNSPTSTLLQVAAVIFGNGSELKRFVNVGRLPSLTEHESRCRHVFGQRAQGKVSNLLQSLSPSDVTGSSAPCYAHGVLDGLNDVNEEIQRLSQRIGGGRVVEQLRRANQGHFGVHYSVGKQSAKPISLRNLGHMLVHAI